MTAHLPKLLRPCKAELLARLPDIRQQEVRWHTAQILPRLDFTREERDSVILPVLREYLRDKSRLVQTFALQALADFAECEQQIRPEVISLVEHATQTGSAAVKSRARRLLPKLAAPLKPAPPGDGTSHPRRQRAPHQ